MARACLSSGENAEIEFKEKASGLDAEDLVAFANTTHGGTILIGVREATNASGIQTGVPVGHSVDDAVRLQILDKALSCSPPVRVELAIENADSKPFMRVTVPPGTQRPYSTKSGTYKIREDGRNAPLHPPQLLKMFIEREAEEFGRRFTEATTQISDRLNATLHGVAELEDSIAEKIEKIGRDLGWADYKMGDTADTIETVEALVRHLIKEADTLTQRLRAIVRKVDAADPVKQQAEERLKKAIIDQLRQNPDLLKTIKEGKGDLSLKGKDVAEFDKNEAQKIFQAALKEMCQEPAKGEASKQAE